MLDSPELADEAVPVVRPVVSARRASIRTAAVAIGLAVIALATGAPWSAVGIVACAALVAMLVERSAARAETAAALRVNTSASRSEGQRDAVAQVMMLQMAYERSRSVLEALGEGVLVVDAGGEIVLANPAARRAMKMPMQDPGGRILWEALTPELAQRARDAFLGLQEVARTRDELPLIRYSAIPCRDCVYDLTAVEATSSRTGQDFGTVFLLVDSTRTHELQRLKDSFLSSVSHELRTPLTNICAYSEILNSLAPGESNEWPEFVRVIHAEGMHLSNLVDGMFDYLQLESGEAQFTSETIDGLAVVQAVLAEFAPTAATRKIQIELRLREASPHLACDRHRLEQVVHNLLANAVKFTPEGGCVCVTVSGREEGWELRIEDSGPGVPAQDRHAVFEKFHQLSDPLTEKSSGTGLGLATSRAIVARFGGLIWCEDSPLGGAAFVVLLPGLGQPKLAAVGGGTGGGGGF